jgi:hypothetical protein
MQVQTIHARGSVIPPFRAASVARILLADADPGSRLTLKSLLETAGYGVDTVGSAADAAMELSTNEYELVLADLPREESAQLFETARQQLYEPATALISSRMSRVGDIWEGCGADQGVVRISVANVSYLLDGMAELLGQRADRRIGLSMRRVV